MKENKKIGLALSGGGYRAAAFHLGTLRALSKLNILDKVDVISAISGGAITGSYFCLNKDSFEKFDKEFESKLQKSIILNTVTSIHFIIRILVYFILVGLITFSCYYFISNITFASLLCIGVNLFILVKYQFKIFPLSEIIDIEYNKLFFKDKKLSDLPSSPLLAINATNIQTGRLWTFSKNKMGDSTYTGIKFNHHNFPISTAVMSSTCVPFAFTPVKIDKTYFDNQEEYENCKPILVDGGVYDNQGVHKLTQIGSSYKCDLVIISDAGNKLPFMNSYNNTLILLIRTFDVFMNRIKNFQMMRNLFESKGNEEEIAYISLGWDLENCIAGFIRAFRSNQLSESVIKKHELDKSESDDNLIDYMKAKTNYHELLLKVPTLEKISIARNVKTNLTSLSKLQISSLADYAEALTELQVRLYCPSLLS